MPRNIVAANIGGQSLGTALLFSTSNNCSSSHFARGRSIKFLWTQISLEAIYQKLGKVTEEVPPILSNFLCGTMWCANMKLHCGWQRTILYRKIYADWVFSICIKQYNLSAAKAYSYPEFPRNAYSLHVKNLQQMCLNLNI